MNEMLDSQLSAMFDDELPEAECELLARRLSRDESLRWRWRHYAVIGAALRGEKGVPLQVDLTPRIAAAVDAEPALSLSRVLGGRVGVTARRLWQGVAGAAVAAGVAAISIMWLQAQSPAEKPILAQAAAPVRAVEPRGTGADSYTVPANVESRATVPPTELANYVVAHSEFSTPLSRRNLLSSLVASEPSPGAAYADTADESSMAGEAMASGQTTIVGSGIPQSATIQDASPHAP